MQSILQTYASFHAAGFRARQGLSEWFPWLMPQQVSLKPELFERSVSALRCSPVTARKLNRSEATLSALLDLLAPLKKFLSGQPETYNFNDFFPGNVAIPTEPGPDHPAVLFDWHLTGAGIVQNDLLNVMWGWAEDDEPLRDRAIQFYLDFFKYGCPPHGGFGMGLNRFLMVLLGLGNVREATYLFRGPNRLHP